tara:strand:- start:79239 stop:80477 length:1239 start_codon:yes stop_codon:yes gene_type:complete
MVTKVFLFFLCAKGLVEAWLDLKNKRYIAANRDAVPDKFKDSIDLSDHQKAADYSITKINVASFFKLLSYTFLLIWTLGGGLEAIDKLARSFEYGPIATGLVFFGIFGAISMLLGLPESIFSTFVIEERFGFNKTTAKTFILDMVKGLILGAIIGLPILAGLLWMMGALGNYWWIAGWAFLTSVQFILLWAYPRFIAPLFNKFSPLEEGEVKEKVLGLLERTGFKSNGLFVMDASMRSSHGNAYFTGFGDNKRIVFFDTLIKTLDAGEVEAVLAHELGHFKRKHIMKQLFKAVIFSFIGFYILGVLYNWLPFYTGHGVSQPSAYMALMLFSMVSGLYTFFLTPLSSFTSRKYEFEADEFASEHSDPNNLITALVKMYKDNASTLTPDPTYSAFYHSHPPALVRVAHLESLQK